MPNCQLDYNIGLWRSNFHNKIAKFCYFIMKIGAPQSDIIIKLTIWHNFDYGIKVD